VFEPGAYVLADSKPSWIYVISLTGLSEETCQLGLRLALCALEGFVDCAPAAVFSGDIVLQLP
jgi:hypothetical protein